MNGLAFRPPQGCGGGGGRGGGGKKIFLAVPGPAVGGGGRAGGTGRGTGMNGLAFRPPQGCGGARGLCGSEQMIFRTFRAATFAEVLRQVRQALGPDAVIVHTRTSLTRRWLGLRREVSVEMTV